MRILGIDPGLATIGIGVLDATSAHDLHVVEWLTIQTDPAPLAQRLRIIHDDLSQYIAKLSPDLAVVERLFFQTNEKTALDVAHARGCILLTLAEHGIPMIEPTPLQLKSSITGDGKATKSQMQSMIVTMLRLSEIPQPDDAADALALAAYGAFYAAKEAMIIAAR